MCVCVCVYIQLRTQGTPGVRKLATGTQTWWLVNGIVSRGTKVDKNRERVIRLNKGRESYKYTDLWTRAIHLLHIEPKRSAETPSDDLNDILTPHCRSSGKPTLKKTQILHTSQITLQGKMEEKKEISYWSQYIQNDNLKLTKPRGDFTAPHQQPRQISIQDPLSSKASAQQCSGQSALTRR